VAISHVRGQHAGGPTSEGLSEADEARLRKLLEGDDRG
jgi:hypothetical protein